MIINNASVTPEIFKHPNNKTCDVCGRKRNLTDGICTGCSIRLGMSLKRLETDEPPPIGVLCELEEDSEEY